ncbi:MAG: polysaccharide biosynthesis C-terminal domain-containing protein [Kiritimatiellae bacterium]|nr:polysaccharide biosynthesis C-terminal domain-containing protein [Kiritimatiellia bacterium]
MEDDARHTMRTVSFGALWRLMRYPFLFLSMAVVPRIMGKEIYGQYAVFMAVFLIWEGFTGLGNVQVFGRFVPECGADDEAGAAKLLHSILFYGLVITAGIAAIAVPVVLWTYQGELRTEWAWVLALTLLLGKTQGTLFAFLFGRNQIGRFSMRDLLRSILMFAFVLVLFLGFGLRGALWALVLNELALAAVGMFWTRDVLFLRPRWVPFREFKPYLLFGITFSLPTMLQSLVQRSGNLFVRELTLSYEQVSFYDIGNQFLLITGAFIGQILVTLVPALTALHLRDEGARAQEWTGRVLAYCGIVAVVVLAALVCLGRHVIRLCLGEAFGGVYRSAVVIAVSLFPLIVGRAGANMTIIRKEPGVYFTSVLAGLFAMTTACVFLVPRWGAIGGAWATVSGYTALAAVYGWRYRADFSPVLRTFAAAVLPGIVVVPCCFVKAGLGLSLALFGLAAAAYVGAVSALKILKFSDARMLLRALSGKGKADPPGSAEENGS